MQGTLGPEVDAGSQDMRETWMLLEYADRGNLDRALVQKKMMTADNCLDLVIATRPASPTHTACSTHWPNQNALLSLILALGSSDASTQRRKVMCLVTSVGHMPEHLLAPCSQSKQRESDLVLQDTVCRCLIDIAAGMDYLHSLGVLHGMLLLPACLPGHDPSCFASR